MVDVEYELAAKVGASGLDSDSVFKPEQASDEPKLGGALHGESPADESLSKAKPRITQNNRKRARSKLHSNDSLVIESSIVRLQVDGQAITGSLHAFLRVIKPYPYTFRSHAKARWIGRTLAEVYSTEFGSYPPSYYDAAIKQGRILVSEGRVAPNYVVRGGDVLSHTVHRHEPAVAVAVSRAPYVTIVQETDTLLVVDKPSTLPVHPCGAYHENSLVNLLQLQYKGLYNIHRLDRLTSGLILFAKTSTAAKKWARVIKQRTGCSKVYVARVRGRFPDHCCDTVPQIRKEHEISGGEYVNMDKSAPGLDEEAMVSYLKRRNALGYWIEDATGHVRECVSLSDLSAIERSLDEWMASFDADVGSDLFWLHLACPTRVAQPKDGVCECGAFLDLDQSTYGKTVKPAETSFAFVRYNKSDDSSIVLCRPATGRTHQIRLHLQYLGHPIANDPNYGGCLWFSDVAGETVSARAQELLDSETSNLVSTDSPATQHEITSMEGERSDEKMADFIRRTCVWCARSKMDQTRNVLEFAVRSPGIWLHALQYKLTASDETLSFRTATPNWAREIGCANLCDVA